MDAQSCILALFTMTTVLLIQLFREVPLGISSLEMELSQRFGNDLVALDSYSDGGNLAYVRKMIEASDRIKAVIWETEGGTLKGMQPIFNALLKKKQAVILITNSSQGVISKLAKTMDTKIVGNEEELIEVLDSPSTLSHGETSI